jgi:hypothetical protein
VTTRLTKPVRRVVTTRRSGELVITLTAEGLTFREKGRRTTYGPLDPGALFIMAVRQHIDAEKRRKAEARKAARAARGR